MYRSGVVLVAGPSEAVSKYGSTSVGSTCSGLQEAAGAGLCALSGFGGDIFSGVTSRAFTSLGDEVCTASDGGDGESSACCFFRPAK